MSSNFVYLSDDPPDVDGVDGTGIVLATEVRVRRKRLN